MLVRAQVLFLYNNSLTFIFIRLTRGLLTACQQEWPTVKLVWHHVFCHKIWIYTVSMLLLGGYCCEGSSVTHSADSIRWMKSCFQWMWIDLFALKENKLISTQSLTCRIKVSIKCFTHMASGIFLQTNKQMWCVWVFLCIAFESC